MDQEFETLIDNAFTLSRLSKRKIEERIRRLPRNKAERQVVFLNSLREQETSLLNNIHNCSIRNNPYSLCNDAIDSINRLMNTIIKVIKSFPNNSPQRSETNKLLQDIFGQPDVPRNRGYVFNVRRLLQNRLES